MQIPRMNPEPHLGLVLMEQSLRKAGHHVTRYDANFEMHQKFDLDSSDWAEIEKWGIQQLDFDALPRRVLDQVLNVVEGWAIEVNKMDPDFIGVSVFSTESRNWALITCYYLRMHTNATILIGGRGLSDPGKATAHYGKDIVNWDLADFFVNGEAEQEIVNIIENKSDKINTSEFFIEEDLTRDDYSVMDPSRFEKYKLKTNAYHIKDVCEMGMIDIDTRVKTNKTFVTRGCIKRCSFCDVPLVRSKFSMREPHNLVTELKEMYYQYGILRNWFGDDMINGSYKHMLAWLDPLAKWIQDEGIQGFSWETQFGIKSRQTTPDELFELMAITGGRPNIGVDHFSDSILDHMEKRYTKDDVFYYYEGFHKYGVISPVTLLIGSYPTETLYDFEILLDSLVEFSKFTQNIEGLDIGPVCTISAGSRIDNMPGMHVYSSRMDWFWEGNPELTPNEKHRRREVLEKHITKLGFVSRKQRTNQLRFTKGANSDAN